MTIQREKIRKENALITDIIETIKRKEAEQKQELMAIYVTGSHLHKTDTVSSDYDMIAITKPTVKSVLTGHHFAQQQVLSVNDVNVDVKSYDTLYVAQKLLKSDLNMVEIFYKTPIFVAFDFEDIADTLSSEDMQKHVLAINSTGAMQSIQNYVRNADVKIKDESMPVSAQRKIVDQTIRYKHYLSDMISTGRFLSVNVPAKSEAVLYDDVHDDTSIIRTRLAKRFEQEKTNINAMIEQIESGEKHLFTAPIDYSRFTSLMHWSYKYGYKPS